MLIPRGIALAIDRGVKTELRRPRRSAQPPFTRPRQVIQYERQRTYEDAPAKHADDLTVTEDACHVIVTEQEPSTLGAMTDADARAEGFRATAGLTALEMYRRWWAEQHSEWSADEPVWVIRFQVDRPDTPRFLARVSGYTETHHLAIDDLEAVSPGEILELNRRHTRALDAAQQRELRKRDARARAAKLKDAERKANVRGIDIAAEVQAIDRYLAAIRAKLQDG
ncbi:MAG: hypothetical protein QOJ29_3683 [Thermoleophilaceae bacterium]|nr:hypothetical protein [Thermoleophilaceae bacterium]